MKDDSALCNPVMLTRNAALKSMVLHSNGLKLAGKAGQKTAKNACMLYEYCGE